MPHDVFVSYASEDKIVADAVCATLESRAVRCWIAPRDVLPGVAYGEAIIDAIHGCRIMILVFSSKSNTSHHIPKEIERAVSAGVAIIPFRIEDVMPGKALDYFIGNVHWLDALTPPLERHLERLVQNVQALLSRDVPVIEGKISPATAVPVSSVASSPVSSVSASARTEGGRSPWLYVALGILTVLVIAFAVLFFTRRPSTTAPVATAPAISAPPATIEPPAAVASQPSGIPSAGNNATAVQSKPDAAATTHRASREDSGVHDKAPTPPQPQPPASAHAIPSTSDVPIYDQGLSAYKSGNFPLAADLYHKACDRGNRLGCTDLGLMYYNGEGVAKDLNRAADLFQHSCDANGAAACTNLGVMYVRGEGVAKDRKRAADLFKRACDGGGALGCTKLGLMYARGENGTRDENRAADLYKGACDQGNAQGCNFLGMLYENGRGVQKDLSRAAALFKQACDTGFNPGCDNLAHLKKHSPN
jgi:TIR domain/Sel1 repeat